MKKSVTVQVNPSLALIKYWGKAEGGINIPATPSIGASLGGIHSRTRLSYDPSRASRHPRIFINEVPQEAEAFAPFFEGFFNALPREQRPGLEEHLPYLRIESSNNFPTAAGLASSSSGFGALAFGLDHLLETDLPRKTLSAIARIGSGSAARTLFGGFTEFPAGAEWASRLRDASFWPDFRIVVLTVSTGPKKVSSRAGMEGSKKSSPFFESWLQDSRTLFAEAREALLAKDLEQLGELSRLSYMRMFSTMFSSSPPLLYWQPLSLEIIHTLEKLRQGGVGAWETMDAGPQIKVICNREDADRVTETFRNLPSPPMTLRLGKGPEVVEQCE